MSNEKNPVLIQYYFLTIYPSRVCIHDFGSISYETGTISWRFYEQKGE